jgi:hypothetical protein
MKAPRWLVYTGFLSVLTGRLWLERDLTQELRAQELLPPKLELEVKDEIGQDAFAAALGGGRALVASIYELRGFSAFLETPSNWPKVDQFYGVCAKLQPMNSYYWVQHAWMLHSNMSEAYGSEGEAPKGIEPEMRAMYREKGLKILLRGLEYLPKDCDLNRAVADYYSQANLEVNPNPDYEKAAEYYLKASKCEGALAWMGRFHALFLAKAPGRELEGYKLLREQYERDPKWCRYPSAIAQMKRVEQKFNLPFPTRIPDPWPKKKGE